MIPVVGIRDPQAPTARLREIRRQLMLFPFSQAELAMLKQDIELQLQQLDR